MLVKDFCKINVDSESFLGVKGDVISLANGRVCCQAHDDLVNRVMEVIGRLERSTHSM